MSSIDQTIYRSSMAFYTTEEILDYFKSGSIREHRLDSEEILFRLGEAVQRIYFIKKGEVRAETYLVSGRKLPNPISDGVRGLDLACESSRRSCFSQPRRL